MRIILILLATFLAVGCSNSKNDYEPSEVIVTVGSENITKDDLDRELNKLSQKQKALYTSSSEKLAEFLETHINQKVLYKEAYERGIQDRDEIRDQIATYEQKLIAKTFGKELLDELELSNEEIQAYYEKNKTKYERLNISKIVIRYDSNNEESKAEALTQAENIAKRADSGESFEDLATEYSDDPFSKEREGKVGYINRGSFPQQIDEIIFDLNQGDITKPFEVDGAYLIIKANTKPDVKPYGQIENTIRSEMINQRLFDYIDSLKEKWDVQIYEDRIEEMYKSESN